MIHKLLKRALGTFPRIVYKFFHSLKLRISLDIEYFLWWKMREGFSTRYHEQMKGYSATSKVKKKLMVKKVVGKCCLISDSFTNYLHIFFNDFPTVYLLHVKLNLLPQEGAFCASNSRLYSSSARRWQKKQESWQEIDD